MNPPRLAVLIGTHRHAQSLLPTLQQSRFTLTHHCLEPAQLYEALDGGEVDVALVSTGPRGLDPGAIARLARRHLPLVVLDDQPLHQRWSSFRGVVLETQCTPEQLLNGLDAALRGERLRPSVHAPDESVSAGPQTYSTTSGDATVEVQPATEEAGEILTIVGAPGGVGRSILGLNLTCLLSRAASCVLVDCDLGMPMLSAYLGANTNKNLVTLAHLAPATPDEWTSALSRDLQPLSADSSWPGLFLGGLPRPEARVQENFVADLLAALRARFDYVVCDTGGQWLDGHRSARVPVELADTTLLVTLPDAGSVRRARHVRDQLRTSAGPGKIGIVVNQHRWARDFDRWDFQFSLGEPLSAVLPFDPDACWRAVDRRLPVVADATRTGVPRYLYRATGSRPRFLGFLRLYREGKDDQMLRDEERQPLPSLAARDPLNLLDLAPKQHFTEPPPRYTEATLVKALEERGIGRPSTYAPTMATIQDREYVELDGKLLRPTLLGQQVNDYLVAHFADVVDLTFTAELEGRLDEIARGQRAWVTVVSAYYQPLAVHVRDAKKGVVTPGGGEPSDEVCSQGHTMVIRDGKFGRFLACSTYPNHQETRPLSAPLGVACPSCGGVVVEKHSRTGSTFFGCATYPTCTWTSSYRPLSEPCPSCGGTRVELDGRRQHCLKHQGPPPRQVIDAAASEQRPRKPASRNPRTTGAKGASIRRSPAKSIPARKSDTHTQRPRKPKS